VVDVAGVRGADAATVGPPAVNEWGRHGYIIAEIHKILRTMEPPWGSLCVFEAASL